MSNIPVKNETPPALVVSITEARVRDLLRQARFRRMNNSQRMELKPAEVEALCASHLGRLEWL